MADPRTAIDVVAADYDTGKFLRDVILFVSAARGTQHSDAVRAVLGHRFTQFVSDELIYLAPTDFLPLAIPADHRRSRPVLVRDVIESVAALHTSMTVIARAIHRRADSCDLAVARANVHFTA